MFLFLHSCFFSFFLLQTIEKQKADRAAEVDKRLKIHAKKKSKDRDTMKKKLAKVKKNFLNQKKNNRNEWKTKRNEWKTKRNDKKQREMNHRK